MIRSIVALSLWLLLVPGALAQTGTVTGVVTDAQTGDPLAGASVVVVGTTTGTATNIEGRYELIAPLDGTLRFTYIGYVAQEVPVDNRSTINLALEPDLGLLDEVVVVGYGQQLERTLTGNISRVTAQDLEDQSVLSVEQALQGRMAGVDIQTQSGKLGQGIQVRVRGASSVSASNQPLYVIDGIPVTTQNLSSTDAATNPMADINPNDIESIEVLKDASAAAIYGARGSNGVVLITTKSGATGRTRVTANYSRAWSAPTNTVDLLNGPQYVELLMEAAANTDELAPGTCGVTCVEYLGGIFDIYSSGADWRGGNANFDWQDQVMRTGGSNVFELSAQGGDANTRFYISGAIDDQTGILINNEYQRLSGRANIEHDVSDRLNVGARLSLSRSLNKRLATDNAFATPMQAIAQLPINPIYEPLPGESGYVPSDNVNHSTVYFNSLLYVGNTRFHTTVYRTLGNAFASLELTPGLVLHSEFGVDVLDQNEDQHYNSQVARGLTDAENGLGIQLWNRVVNYTTNSYLNYQDNFGDHGFDATVGTSFQNADWNWSSVTGTQFPSDDFTQISSAAEITSGTGGRTAYRFLSYFGRVNYQFMDRYLLTMSGRVDGSSRFGSNNRYGFFPAVSAGWIMSDESFMENSPFSLLKLRASYGLTGNAEIGNFDSRGLWSASGYGGLAGTFPSQTPNPDLAWERTTQMDLGIDFGLFNDRIETQLDYYRKDTRDLLLNVQVPASTGFTTQTQNVGRLRNHGIELALNTRNLTGDFGWTSNFIFGLNRNEITDLDGQVIAGGFVNRAVEGQPIGVFFTLEYAGVDPANGDALFYINEQDENGNIIDPDATTNNPNDANPTVVGDPNPDFTGGFGNQFTYAGFSLDVLFQFSYGNDIYDGGGRFKSANGDYFDNQHADQLNRWQQPGDETDVPQARFFLANGVTHSSRYLYDGSYLRLKHVALSYQLPRNYIDQLGLQNARVYVTGQNLLTWTKYPWWDPEVNADFTAGNIGLGNEFYTAPQARSITTGIQLTF